MSENPTNKALAPNVKTRPDDARGGGAPGISGNAPFRPTEEQRRMVRELAKVVPYATQHIIAHKLKISSKTLVRHFADDLNEGRAELAIALGTQAVNRAMNMNAVDANGNVVSKGDPDMLKFTLARLCGWSTKVEVTGKDGGPVETVDFSRFTKEEMLAYGKLAAAQRGIRLNDDGEEVGSAPTGG